MLDTTRQDRRRQATRSEILEAAWALARRDGIAAIALRDLAQAVGMRAPSLYSYFASKNELYDALFAQGYRAFLERAPVGAAAHPSDARAVVADAIRTFMAFCREDTARYQLLFTPAVPGFVPSDESMELARTALAVVHERLAQVGLGGAAEEDLFVALVSGLVNQQIANDPDGDRWERLIDRAAEMFVGYVADS